MGLLGGVEGDGFSDEKGPGAGHREDVIQRTLLQCRGGGAQKANMHNYLHEIHPSRFCGAMFEERVEEAAKGNVDLVARRGCAQLN